MNAERYRNVGNKSHEGRVRNFIIRFVRTSAVLLLIFYAAILLISRTDGFRHLVEDRISARTNSELHLGGVQINPRFEMLIHDIRMAGAPDDIAADFQIDSVRTSLSFHRLFSSGNSFPVLVEISGADLIFSRDENGGWLPAYFSERSGFFADLVGAGVRDIMAGSPESQDKSSGGETDLFDIRYSGFFGEESGFLARDVRIRWKEQDGSLLAELRDMNFDLTLLRVPGRKIQHCRFSAGYGLMVDGRSFQDMRMEFISAGGRTVILDLNLEWLDDKQMSVESPVSVQEKQSKGERLMYEDIRKELEDALR